MALNTAFWRKWHRWVAFPATIFLIWAAATGLTVAFTEFFGEAEALREATRDLVSPVTSASPEAAWRDAIGRAITVVNDSAPSAPIDKITVQFKGDHPTVTVFTGKPGGGEDRQFVVDATSGHLDKVESYKDKPLINRLHSGEAFGDGGLVVAMFWALALLFLSVTGLIIYLRIRKPNAVGLEKIFW
jgi:uncharacterized iron-regulated membrane protein